MTNKEKFEELLRADLVWTYDKQTVCRNRDFDEIIEPLYDWIKKLKVLGTHIHVNILNQNGDLQVCINSSDRIMVPANIKNINIYNISHTIPKNVTLQSIKNITYLDESVINIVHFLDSDCLVLTHNAYLELEEFCLSRLNHIIKVLEENNNNIMTYIKLDRIVHEPWKNIIYYIDDILAHHLKYKGLELENSQQTLDDIRWLEDDLKHKLQSIKDKYRSTGDTYAKKDTQEIKAYKDLIELRQYTKKAIEFMKKH